MQSMIRVVLILALVSVAVISCATRKGGGDSGTSLPPNILLIISDDVGMDVTTDMYPGLIDDLVKKYGPSGHNHPDFSRIKGRQASTPVMDRFAGQGMRFASVWAHPFCSPTRAALITGI